MGGSTVIIISKKITIKEIIPAAIPNGIPFLKLVIDNFDELTTAPKIIPIIMLGKK